ncbi:MAG: tRNA pseudouridine(13) synthase TruD [Archangium sp.]|nr:tRNA pseudouridine(13) synthase TruD [Archangium sp.]
MSGELPTLTRELPGCGGVFKATPEDFVVEEIPAYEPSGEADCEHLFLWIEKRGRSTQDVAKALARHCGMQEKDVSWAGLKDRQAVTRQYLCAPARYVEPKLATFALEGVTVLRTARHRNKLKGGHLRGNRFELVVRGVTDQAVAKEVLARLVRLGIPNFFGEQRFGVGGDNAEKGKRILQAGGRHRDRFERKLFLSAYQSDLFNRVLARRLEGGTFATALQGDVLKKNLTGGEFICAEPAVDQPRVDSLEVSPTGPLFGPEMRRPEGVVDALEEAVLTEEGITRELFVAGGNETMGARRLLRIAMELESAEAEGDVLRLKFSLPAGSYATVLLRELLKD